MVNSLPSLRKPGRLHVASSSTGTASYAAATASAASASSPATVAGSCSAYLCSTAVSSWSQLANVGASCSSIERSRTWKVRCTSRTWQAYSAGDHVDGSGRVVAVGRPSTADQVRALSRMRAPKEPRSSAAAS